MESEFKQKNNFEERKKHFLDLAESFPDKIPIICEKAKRSKTLVALEKTKYLVDYDFPLVNFANLIRSRLGVQSTEGIFFLVNQNQKKQMSLPISEQPIKDIYDKYKDEDGFLYIFYEGEQVWG